MTRPDDTEPSAEAQQIIDPKPMSIEDQYELQEARKSKAPIAQVDALEHLRGSAPPPPVAEASGNGDPLVKGELRAQSLELGWCPTHGGYHRNYQCEHGYGVAPQPTTDHTERARRLLLQIEDELDKQNGNAKAIIDAALTAAERANAKKIIQWLEARAINIRDNGPKSSEGLLTAMAGAHVGALIDAATALRALAARDATLTEDQR